jgi:hypothetical protein
LYLPERFILLQENPPDVTLLLSLLYLGLEIADIPLHSAQNYPAYQYLKVDDSEAQENWKEKKSPEKTGDTQKRKCEPKCSHRKNRK